MAKHQDLTGRAAIHPFAFVGATDPSLDATNYVTAYKAWLDNSDPIRPLLKIRDVTNTSWTTVISGAPSSTGFPLNLTEITYLYTTTDAFGLPTGILSGGFTTYV